MHIVVDFSISQFRQLHEQLHPIGILAVLYLFTFRVTPPYSNTKVQGVMESDLLQHVTSYFAHVQTPNTPHIDYALTENNFVVNYYMTDDFWNPQMFLFGIKYQNSTRNLLSTCLQLHENLIRLNNYPDPPY